MKKKWVVAKKFSEDIISQLLHSRGLRDKNTIADFFNPPTPGVISTQYSTYLKKINPGEVRNGLALIEAAIKDKRPIVIHGDYDVDGICGTAILYQTLQELGANVTPFIPDRFSEGYGLSIESIDKVQTERGKPLLITTDCGISAVDEVKYAKEKGLDIVITDHHTKKETLPEADAIVWTDELAGAGIAWLLAEILKLHNSPAIVSQICNEDNADNLDLVALATIADVQPLTGINRALVKYGLEELNRTQSVGLRELIKISGLEEKEIGTYEVGWILGPRLNASGRLQHAVDSLNLLLTDDPVEAQRLASRLNEINQERQQITKQAVEQARDQHQAVYHRQEEKLILLSHAAWHEGVIGLVAGRIREEFYRPTLIISQGKEISKGSARSVPGFNIVEALRECQEFLRDSGGHAMAAGFTIETEKITVFRDKLCALARDRLPDDKLMPTLSIDADVSLSDLNWGLMESLKKFAPFGVGNPWPVFLSRGVRVLDVGVVGSGGDHLKIRVRQPDNSTIKQFSHFFGIGFGFGHLAAKLRPGDLIDIVYNLEENIWQGRRTLQLKLKDIRHPHI